MMPEPPTAEEIAHLRGAKGGGMYRVRGGQIVIRPVATAGRRASAAGASRRRASKDVVAELIAKGWLKEGPTLFIVTAAGAQVLAADERRQQLHAELYRERFGAW